MDTSSCVMGIERFCARRGVPSVLWSDNGTNFVASEKEQLTNVTAWNQQVINDSLVKKRIKWEFNPPSDPITVVFGNAWFEASSTFSMRSWEIVG